MRETACGFFGGIFFLAQHFLNRLKLPSFPPSGFNLFKTFFENVNLCDHRLKRQGTQLVSRRSHCLPTSLINDLRPRAVWESNNTSASGVFQCVERLDLTGMDFIWRIAMESPDEEIANEAIQLIITYSYTNLNPKMKKVSLPLCTLGKQHSVLGFFFGV